MLPLFVFLVDKLHGCELIPSMTIALFSESFITRKPMLICCSFALLLAYNYDIPFFFF